jgi:plastocyanin
MYHVKTCFIPATRLSRQRIDFFGLAGITRQRQRYANGTTSVGQHKLPNFYRNAAKRSQAMGNRLRPACALALLTSALAVMASGCATKSDGEEPGAKQPDNVPVAGKSMPEAHAVKTAPVQEEVPNQITIDNFRFSPRELTVTAGTKVTWVNNDDVPHTATSSAKPRSFDSKTLDTDDKFSHVFTTPGTYDYFCAVHPHMTGRIIVK